MIDNKMILDPIARVFGDMLRAVREAREDRRSYTAAKSLIGRGRQELSVHPFGIGIPAEVAGYYERCIFSFYWDYSALRDDVAVELAENEAARIFFLRMLKVAKDPRDPSCCRHYAEVGTSGGVRLCWVKNDFDRTHELPRRAEVEAFLCFLTYACGVKRATLAVPYEHYEEFARRVPDWAKYERALEKSAAKRAGTEPLRALAAAQGLP